MAAVWLNIPRDPVVPSERQWDWGIIYYNLEGDLYLLSVWIHRAWFFLMVNDFFFGDLIFPQNFSTNLAKPNRGTTSVNGNSSIS